LLLPLNQTNMAHHNTKCHSLDLHHRLLFKDLLPNNHLLSKVVVTPEDQLQMVTDPSPHKQPLLQAPARVACSPVDQVAQLHLSLTSQCLTQTQELLLHPKLVTPCQASILNSELEMLLPNWTWNVCQRTKRR
jgi:hypothetical protein